jgi:hypothetical protein
MKGAAMSEADKDRVIEELRVKIHTQGVVINILRGLLFTGWSLTNDYDRDPGSD